ncbi:fructosamine kinase [Streptomyces sp. NP160]|uniref:fructosamine kinase family protein n=1 Tax=Streptomyces sp. NP160 TaxID=2586637 RepID=UPI001117B783|nr:fructosamine kinase family protein [Streptomyces sp. NP160]TNM69071.1 fructosamine kinase [Streptomyces sp. NP160]
MRAPDHQLAGSATDDPFVKSRASAPEGFFAVEAAGLAWLAEAVPAGGVPVPPVLEVTRERIVLPRLQQVPPTPGAAERFGRQLAATHAAGAPHHGSPPAGWDDDGWIGTARLPHAPGATAAPGGWGAFFARLRLAPHLAAARDAGALDDDDARVLERLCARLEEGAWDDGRPPSRLHGDLWSGNALWTAEGVVLVDPAAHGGHAETDLGMLALFGLPHLERVLASYDEAAPLADGWRERVRLHQVHPLLVHAQLFGGSYGAAAGRAARAALGLL